MVAMKNPLAALVFSLFVAASVGVIAHRTVDRGNAATMWTANPAEAARIERVESHLPPITIGDEPPIVLTLVEWMKTFNVPGLSVAVFDHQEIVGRRPTA